jgi:hypothetical protein
VRPRRPLRSFDLHQHLTILFVCGVATVIFTRGFLAATGYPQVGGSSLHIAHVLWGGLLMLTALLALLAFLSPTTRPLAAVIGGVGLGLFIDEVGKFVTKDVNYFYRPAIAIIYVVFVVLFAAIRWLSRRRFTATEATLIGLESLQRAAAGALSDERRALVLNMMQGTGATGALAEGVRELLRASATTPEHPPLTQRLSRRLETVWTRLTAHRLFRVGIYAVLVVAAAISAAEAGWLLRHGTGGFSFSRRAYAATTVASDALLLVGALRLRRSLLSALHWYDHAVLLEITVAQVFLYGSEQLAATLDLVALLAVWGLLRWAIHFETAREVGTTKGGLAAALRVQQ